MATKVIYFTVFGKNEQAEFDASDDNDDVKDVFRAAAEAGPHDILKMYNTKGSLINISAKLPANSPDTRYKLEVVATHVTVKTIAKELGYDIPALEERVLQFEKTIKVDGGEMPKIVQEMKRDVNIFRQKLESVEHLSWLGLFKDISSGTSLQPFWSKNSIKKSADSYHSVYVRFIKMCQVKVTDEVRQYLKKPTFDNWQWDDPEMLVLLRQMFLDLKLVEKFNIEMSVLHEWLFLIYINYNHVPFHNFKHCFMVSQMMYGLIWLIGLQEKLDELDILTLLLSAICHDLDHPGYNNAYQINARTELALRYNDISPLENHHCSKAFEILGKPETNILSNVDFETFRKIREGMIKCILATDMAKHSEILNNFKAVHHNFDFENKDHRTMLLMILIKVADISNEARPMEVAEPWVECLLQEFFNQSDVEKLEGLPVAPFMDREKVSKPSSQIGFIKFVLLPLFETLGQLFPVIEGDIIDPVRMALNHYTEMNNVVELQRKKRVETSEINPK